jgi:hypothetical protein
VIKSRTGHVKYVIDMRNAYKILVTNLKRNDHFRDLFVDGRIIKKKRS